MQLEERRSPIVIAHRGASRAAPGNTLEAFRAARVLGADWVELDVRTGADHRLVVHHDAHYPDGRAVVSVASDARPAHVPLLSEAIEASAGMGVNIEIKCLPGEPDHGMAGEVAEAVVATARELRPPRDVLVSSFDPAIVARVRATDPGIATALLTFLLAEPATAVRAAAAAGHRAMHPFDPTVDEQLVVAAHAAGLAVNVWTVDDPRRLAELAALGVDGIVTNVPDVARRVLDAR